MKLFAVILLISMSIATACTWFAAQEELAHPMDFWKLDDQGDWTGEWDYWYEAKTLGFYWLAFFCPCFFLGPAPLLMWHSLPVTERIVTRWSRRTRILVSVGAALILLVILWSISKGPA